MEDKIKSLEKVFSMRMMGESQMLFEKDYFGCVEHLIKKYGAVTDDYFTNENCSTKGKYSRTKDGLFCHHIYEYEYPLICNPDIAKKLPYELQLKENLCYCNILEHLILHIKIDDEYRDHNYSCGTTVICQTISKYLAHRDNTELLAWENNCKKTLVENLNNLVTLEYVIGYLVTVEHLLGKRSYLDKCKIIGETMHSSVMLDLVLSSLDERRCAYSLKRFTSVFTYFGDYLWKDIEKYDDVNNAISDSRDLIYNYIKDKGSEPYKLTNIDEILITHRSPSAREYKMTYDDIGKYGYNPKKKFKSAW